MNEFAQMDDVEFLAERRRVRNQIDCAVDGEPSQELLSRYEAFDAEFLRRAGLAWAQAS